MAETYKRDPFDFSDTPSRIDLSLEQVANAPLPTLLRDWTDTWQNLLTEGADIPAKADLKMSRLSGLLPHVVIFEKSAPGTYVVRLAGTEVETWLGVKLTGIDPLALVPEYQRNRVGAVYDNVTNQPCGFYISEALMFSRGKQAQATTLKLPLLDSEGKPRFFVAIYHFAEGEYLEVDGIPSAAEHRRIERLGYIDIGFGLPS